MSTTDEIVFYGDPHGSYGGIRRILSEGAPGMVVFLGDMDLDEPFHEVVKPLLDAGTDVRFIHGNHDTDREQWHDNLFESELADRNLSSKVIEFRGVRIAGLGGVFRQKVWHPKDGEGKPVYTSRRDFMRSHKGQSWRGGLPRGQRSTIFPEDLDQLADLRADILVSHEAPSCHRYGFEEIDLIAQVMGCHTVIHGHHHERSRGMVGNIRVIGLDKAEILRVDIALLAEADWEDRMTARITP